LTGEKNHFCYLYGIRFLLKFMSRYQYFEELSGGSSDNDLSSDDNDDDLGDSDDDTITGGSGNTCGDSNQRLRTVIHLDVDCFYCQCEILDRGLDPDRPLAIGQKHIVVTCNYAAREEGVTKLMNRTDAQRRCPNLLIAEGSDLQRYRIHGRKIYESFRRSIKALCRKSSVRKGCMDEMMADIALLNEVDMTTASLSSEDIFVYNKSSNDAAITLTEDQSGVQTIVAQSNRNRADFSSPNDTMECAVVRKKLYQTAMLALNVRQAILDETGFTTTLGVSFNPMMAKLASGLRKPGKVNILEPSWASRQLVESMPLRKIPGIGSKKMKILIPCLENRHGVKGDASSPWICRYE
jgi:DNA polymerase iota